MVIGTALFDLCPEILQPAVSQAHPCFQAKLPRPVYMPRGNLDLDKGLYSKGPQEMAVVPFAAQDAKASDVIKGALAAGWNAMLAYRKRAFRRHPPECWPSPFPQRSTPVVAELGAPRSVWWNANPGTRSLGISTSFRYQ